jgi:hypothetical protein
MPVLRTHTSTFKTATSEITPANHWDHIQARWGIKRAWHRVEPGLYQLGTPTPQSPVFVTGNYTLSFDALRVALTGMDAFILVLDTFGVNVWCAAGKGTFGTRELIHRVQDTRLAEKTIQRILILPQLGAPGVAAHEVKKATGFRVEYGPIHAEDLPEYMKTRKATQEMRTVRFPLKDRIVLIPVELVGILAPMSGAILVGYLLGGWLTAAAMAAAFLAGIVLFPILLPYLPSREFSLKGYTLGILTMLPCVFSKLFNTPNKNWQAWLGMLGYLLLFPAITAFISLNFTGATPFTSKSGVRYEMARYIPVMAWTFGVGLVLTVTHRILNLLGVS